MAVGWKPEPLGPFNRAIGAIPYSVAFTPKIELRKENWYRPTRDSFYIQLEWKSLDWIFNFRIVPRSPWIYREKKTGSFVNFSIDEGWWMENGETGRRTRPMPKVLAAILCMTLIVVYPKILEVTLAHAGTANNPNVIYAILCLVTTLFVVLIAFYIWVGHKSRPSGFENILKQLGRSMGEKNEPETPDETAKSVTRRRRERIQFLWKRGRIRGDPLNDSQGYASRAESTRTIRAILKTRTYIDAPKDCSCGLEIFHIP